MGAGGYINKNSTKKLPVIKESNSIQLFWRFRANPVSSSKSNLVVLFFSFNVDCWIKIAGLTLKFVSFFKFKLLTFSYCLIQSVQVQGHDLILMTHRDWGQFTDVPYNQHTCFIVSIGINFSYKLTNFNRSIRT